MILWRATGICKDLKTPPTKPSKVTNMSKLTGKVALVTGGNRGIGLAAARRFVDEGAFVFIAARRKEELERAKMGIGRNVSAVQTDVTKMGTSITCLP